jgi:UDP-N-acetylmuramoylalanine--D-glutamate ligase
VSVSNSASARESLRGKRATVMGLGLQGGGVETVRYLAAAGARVTVTDLRPAEKLGESLRAIAGLDVQCVLGEHRVADFSEAQLVVANPAVAPDN